MTARRTVARAARAVAPDTRTPDAADGDDDGVQDAQTDAEQADDEIQALRDQLPEGAMATLWRFGEGTDKEFVEEMPVSEFSINVVRQRYGGGKYAIFLRKPDPDIAGRWIRQGSKRFRIFGPSRFNVPDATPATPAASTDGTLEFMRKYGEMIQQQAKAQMEGQEMLQRMQMAVLANLTRPATDPTADLLKTLLPELIRGRKNDAPPLSMSDVVALADRLAQRTSPSSSLKETMELLTAARELGGDSDQPAWMTIASRGIDAIASVAHRQVAPAPPPAAVAALPAGTPVPPTPETPPMATAQPDDPFFRLMAPMFPGLLRHAQQDHDPATYAGVILDLLPVAAFADVRAFVTDPEFMARLQAAFPAVATTMQDNGDGTVLPWFAELRDQLAERLAEELAPPEPSAEH